jgi:hypothetical protein
MEAEQLLNMNHHAQGAPAEKIAPVAEPSSPLVMTLDELLEQREQLIQGLNGARAQLEIQAQSVTRTEGALMITNQMITRLDPTAFGSPLGAQGG